MKKFSSQTIKKLNYYVYILTYGKGQDETIFYVGKGKSNRIFKHFDVKNKIDISSLSNHSLTEKQKIIINSECNAYIVEASLSSNESLRIEALLISILSTFPNAYLTNIVNGHHKFGVHNVKEIEFKYSKPINLEEFCKLNKIKVLTLKANFESYTAGIKKDFRGTLEGIWSVDVDKLAEVDYILGIYEGTIYGIYKLIQGSIKSIHEFTQESWDRWNQIHLVMGRPERYALDVDADLATIDKNKKVFDLKAIAIPESQFIKVKSKLSDEEKIIGKKLFNRTISDKKISGRSGRYYFGF